MKFLIPLLCLVLGACSGTSESDPATDNETPSNVDPGTDDPGTDDPATDQSEPDEPDDPVVDPEPEPIEIDMPDVDDAALPVLPGCLQGDNPEGCAALPDAPIFSDWECPEGWDSVPAGDEAGFNYCEPPATGLGLECPEGEWPAALVEGNLDLPFDSWVIFVDDDSTVTASNPNLGMYIETAVPTLQAAMEFALFNIDNGVNVSALIVAKGNYAPVVNTAGIRIIGTCAEETKIIAAPNHDRALVFAGPGGGSLEHFSVVGATKGVLIQDTQATLKDVVLTHQYVETQALDDTDTSITIEDSVIQDLTGETAVTVADRASLTMRRSVIRDIEQSQQEVNGQIIGFGGIGINVSRQAVTTLENVQIEDSGTGVVLGHPDDASWRATLNADHLVMDNVDVGLLVGSYVTVEASDLVFSQMGMASMDAMNATINGERWYSRIDPGAYTSFYASNSSVELSDVDIAGGMLGMGFTGSSSLSLSRVAVRDHLGSGIDLIGPGLSASVSDILIENSQLFPLVLKTADVSAERLQIQSSRTLGISAYASSLDASDLTINNIQPLEAQDYDNLRIYYEDVLVDDLVDREGYFGQGLLALGGSEITLTRANITDVKEVGIWAKGEGTTVSVSDLYIADVEESLQEVGVGLWADSGAKISAERGLIERCATDGVYARDEGTEIDLVDIAIRDLATEQIEQPQVEIEEVDDVEEVEEVESVELVQGKGRGLAVDHGASVEAQRMSVERTRTAGVWIVGEGTSGVLADITISEVSHGGFERTGSGVVVATGAQMSMDRAHISKSTVAGVWVQGVIAEVEEVEAVELLGGIEEVEEVEITSAVLSNVSVERTRVGHFTGKRGNGIHVTHGGSAEVSNANVSENDGNGVVAIMEGSHLEISDSIVIGSIEEVESVESVESVEEVESGDDEVGNGIAVIHGGSVEAREVTVWGHVQAGVLISHQVAASVEVNAKSSDGENSEVEIMSHVSLEGVSIVENSYGLCINGIPGFDLDAMEDFDMEDFDMEDFDMEDFDQLGISSIEMLGIDVFDNVSSQDNENDLSTSEVEVTMAARMETASVERSLSQATISEVESVE